VLINTITNKPPVGTIEGVLRGSIGSIKSIVGSRFHGEYVGYRLDPIPFIIIRIEDSLIEVPITNPAFKAILEKTYRTLEDYEKAMLLAYEASGIFRVHPYYIQLLILDAIQLSQLLGIRTANTLVETLLEHPLSRERAGMIGRRGVEWLVRAMINVGLLNMPEDDSCASCS
jgi:hypothetical protein